MPHDTISAREHPEPATWPGQGAAAPRIVHVVAEAPRPSGSGALLRSHALSRALSKAGHVTTIALLDDGPPERPDLPRHPSRIKAAIPGAMIGDLVTRVAAAAPDFVVVESTRLADAADALVAAGHRVVLDAHNVESALLRQIDTARRGRLAWLSWHGRWRQAREVEAALVGRVDTIWACSQGDARALAALSGAAAPIRVVPNPVPDWCQDARRPSPDDGNDILFVGHLAYPPNIRAAQRLAQRILPRLMDGDTSPRLILAGRTPNRKLQALAGTAPGIELIADPADLAPLYARAAMTLIPLTEGGGTRIKILEAMACGLPVIATAKAVEGLDLVAGRHFLAAETDHDFAAAASHLRRDPDARARLQCEAQDFVRQHHSQRAIDAAVLEAITALRPRPTQHEPAERRMGTT